MYWMLPPTHKSLNEMHHNLLLSKMAYSLNSLHSQCTDRPIKIKSYKSDTTCSEAAIRHKIMNWFIICIYIYIYTNIYFYIYHSKEQVLVPGRYPVCNEGNERWIDKIKQYDVTHIKTCGAFVQRLAPLVWGRVTVTQTTEQTRTRKRTQIPY